jgi:hypothetical protein
MVDIDWRAPVGRSAKVLRCIPTLNPETFKKWRQRDKFSRRGATPQGTVWHAHDVLEIAAAAEVSGLSMLHSKQYFIWLQVQKRMFAREHPMPRETYDHAFALYLDAIGSLCCREFRESDPSGLNLDHPEAPESFVVFRVDRFIDRIAARIAAVAPGAVRQ